MRKFYWSLWQWCRQILLLYKSHQNFSWLCLLLLALILSSFSSVNTCVLNVPLLSTKETVPVDTFQNLWIVFTCRTSKSRHFCLSTSWRNCIFHTGGVRQQDRNSDPHTAQSSPLWLSPLGLRQQSTYSKATVRPPSFTT